MLPIHRQRCALCQRAALGALHSASGRLSGRTVSGLRTACPRVRVNGYTAIAAALCVPTSTPGTAVLAEHRRIE